jgi:response regulator NasT
MTETRGSASVTSRNILIAGERCRYKDEISAALVLLGNHVLSKHPYPAQAEQPVGESPTDLVVVVAGLDRAFALRLIGTVRHEARLPVVAAIERGDEEWTVAAVAAGAAATVIGTGLEGLRATVHAACERFAELRKLEQALERRAVIERAKGVLMVSQGVTGDEAFVLLRDHSRRTNRKLVDLADSIVTSHALLGRQRAPASKPPAVAPTAALPSRPEDGRRSRRKSLVGGEPGR